MWNSYAATAIQNIIKIMEMELLQRLRRKQGQEEDAMMKAKEKFAEANDAARHGFTSVMKALPFPANVIIAPAVAAGAFAAVMAFDKGGIVPEDSLAMVHKNEMVLTPSLSAAIQDMAKSGGGNQYQYQRSQPVNITVNGNADRSTVEQIGHAVRRAIRRGELRWGDV